MLPSALRSVTCEHPTCFLCTRASGSSSENGSRELLTYIVRQPTRQTRQVSRESPLLSPLAGRAGARREPPDTGSGRARRPNGGPRQGCAGPGQLWLPGTPPGWCCLKCPEPILLGCDRPQVPMAGPDPPQLGNTQGERSPEGSVAQTTGV